MIPSQRRVVIKLVVGSPPGPIDVHLRCHLLRIRGLRCHLLQLRRKEVVRIIPTYGGPRWNIGGTTSFFFRAGKMKTWKTSSGAGFKARAIEKWKDQRSSSRGLTEHFHSIEERAHWMKSEKNNAARPADSQHTFFNRKARTIDRPKKKRKDQRSSSCGLALHFLYDWKACPNGRKVKRRW